MQIVGNRCIITPCPTSLGQQLNYANCQAVSCRPFDQQMRRHEHQTCCGHVFINYMINQILSSPF